MPSAAISSDARLLARGLGPVAGAIVLRHEPEPVAEPVLHVGRRVLRGDRRRRLLIHPRLGAPHEHRAHHGHRERRRSQHLHTSVWLDGLETRAASALGRLWWRPCRPCPSPGDEDERLRGAARRIRERILRIVYDSGSGHVGGALSQADLLVALYHRYLSRRSSAPGVARARPLRALQGPRRPRPRGGARRSRLRERRRPRLVRQDGQRARHAHGPPPRPRRRGVDRIARPRRSASRWAWR